MPETLHAELSASSAERWTNCAGSVALIRGLPNRSSPYAREGTAAHHVAASAIADGVSAFHYSGNRLSVDGEQIEITDEMCHAVQEYLDHVNMKVENAAEGSQRFVEVQFDLTPLSPPAEMYGTADHVLWDPEARVLDIDDYKHGIGVAVDAHENIQLTYYALGAVLALRVRPELVRITIVQPRAHHREGSVRSFEFDWDHLVAFKQELFENARAALVPDAPLNVGPWCRFCPGQAVCPAQRALAVEAAQTEFDVAEPELPEANLLTDTQLNRALEIAPAVEDWFRSIRALLQARLEAGEEIPGWKLVAKRAMRKWTDEDAAVTWAQGAGIEEPYTRKPMSPAQVETELKKMYPKKVRPDLPEALVEKKSSGNHLAPATDHRPAVNVVTAQEEFTALPPADK
jgi:hypothetical protein